MFTGIVEELGEVTGWEELADAARITVRGPVVTGDTRHGDSIAVNGVCLTVIANEGGTFTADVMRETLARSALGALVVGSPVNLERAVRLQDRLGGHLVQGHVDGTAEVQVVTPDEHWTVVRLSLPTDLARYVVQKGAIVFRSLAERMVARPRLHVQLFLHIGREWRDTRDESELLREFGADRKSVV